MHDRPPLLPAVNLGPNPVSPFNVAVNRLNFRNGNSAGDGGAIYTSAYDMSMTVTGTTFTANTAQGSGGAIDGDYSEPGRMTATRDTFTRNTAGGNGGAIYNATPRQRAAASTTSGTPR